MSILTILPMVDLDTIKVNPEEKVSLAIPFLMPMLLGLHFPYECTSNQSRSRWYLDLIKPARAGYGFVMPQSSNLQSPTLTGSCC